MIWLASIFSLVLRVSLLFPPLKVNWAFREGGGEGGKAVDVSAGHFWTKAN